MNDDDMHAADPDQEEGGLGKRSREEILRRIEELHKLSRRGLWGLLAFILLTAGVVQATAIFPDVPAEAREVLGASPSPNLISIALAIYIFSALILILARMMGGTRVYKGWSHLGYLGVFYLFYYYARALDQNFWAVFASGVTILSLEYYGLWTWCNETIRKEKENLVQLERRNKFGLS